MDKRFHRLVYGTDAPLIPLSVESIVAVASLFKKGGYRGFGNYLTAVKALHVEADYPWSDLLGHTVTWVTRSVERGIGPARQSCSFEFHKLALLDRSVRPLVSGGPQQPVHLALLATLFLLREIEASTALSNAWVFDHSKCEVCWRLPASKTDHLALGVSRKLGCFCGSAMEACPYHIACAHLGWLQAQPSYRDDTPTPLFPTENGTAAAAAKVVETFEELGLLMGMALFNSEGMRLFGGHTPRVTGSRLYAACGIEVNKIRILARHSGDMILRYVAEAPLESLRADLGLSDLQRPSGVPAPTTPFLSAPGTPGRIAREGRALSNRLSLLEQALTSLQDTVQTQAQDVVAIATGFCRTDRRIYVQNTASAAVHFATSSDTRSTACGWPFGTARRLRSGGPPFRIIDNLVDIPGSMLCETCLPLERTIALSVRDALLSGDEADMT
jgi:hypothetical protein